MIYSPYLLILSIVYLGCLAGVIALVKKKVDAKRYIIRNEFGLEGKNICDAHAQPQSGKLILLNWSLAFIFAGVLLQTWIISGGSLNSIWLQTLLIELVFLVLGLLIYKIADIQSWYKECFITSYKPFYYSIMIMSAAIIVSNAAFALPMDFQGITAQLVAVLLMLFAFGFLIWPIHIEQQYYKTTSNNGR